MRMEIQDSFLLDEVRCGFLVPAAMKQAWAADLEVLAEIDRVCKKHNIQYFADWGTLLGTVRHGGFVPWDDDLDIVMKREDYIKFMTVARFDMEEGFDVQTFRNHEDCWTFMGKVVGKNGFCFDKEHLRRFHNFPYIASVDVFVLDYVYRDPEKEEKRRVLCKYMLGVADAIVEGRFTPEEKERDLRRIEEMAGRKIDRIEDAVEMGRYLYGEVEKIFAEVPEQEADCLTRLFPWGLKGSRRHYAKEYYSRSVELPFEGITIPVPMMYDEMLRRRYKGCMKLVKNSGAHNYPFFEGQKKNLQKVLDFKLPEFEFERAKLFRNKEEEAYKTLSYKAMTRECIEELWRMKEQLAELMKDAVVAQEVQEEITILFQNSQQLAVDLGNMLEQFLGEGCAIISLLERYCEAIYELCNGLMSDVAEKEIVRAYNQLCELQQAISVEVEQNIMGRRTVLFLPVMSKDWGGLHKLWQDAVMESKNDVYVVPLPYYYKDYDGSPRKVCCDVNEFPEELCALDYNCLTPEYLEMLHPEIIIIQNPYDSWNAAISVPEVFYAESIRKYTEELVYVPPFMVEEYTKRNEREYFNMKYYVTMPGVVYADLVLVQSENMRKLYIEKLTEFAGDETRDVWAQKVKAWGWENDNYCVKSADENGQRKKILYGISLGACMPDVKTALEKIERNLQMFSKYKQQIDLMVQIFPDNHATTELRECVTRLLEHCGGELVACGVKSNIDDYVAYYGDAMPAVVEFREAGKPAMIQ